MKRFAVVVAAFSLACAGARSPEPEPAVVVEKPASPAVTPACTADAVPHAMKAIAVLTLDAGESAVIGTEVAAFGLAGDKTCIGAPNGANSRWAWVPTASLEESPAPLAMTGNFQGAHGFIRISRVEGSGLEITGVGADNSPLWAAVSDIEPPGGTVNAAKPPGCSVALTRLGDSLLWAVAAGCPGDFSGLYQKQSLR